MRSFLLPLGALALAAVIAACSSSGTTTHGSSSSSGGGSGGSSSGGGSGGSSGSGSSSGATVASDAAVDGDIIKTDAGDGLQSYTVQFGPISVGASVEDTQCIVVRLGNPTPIHVGQIHDLLGNASHHMILYKVADTTEQPTPFACQPFTDTLNPADGNPLIISQKKDDTLTLPQGVAFTLDANQMVRLEMHYINAGTSPVSLTTTSTLTPIPDAEYMYDASFLFIGDIDIDIPAQSSFTLGPQFFQMPAQFNTSNFFAMTGHEHQWGTEVQIWSATSASDSPGTPIYMNTTWSDPVTTHFTPPFQVPAGGGFNYQCNWYNASTEPVGFGESANDEMCFFWAYYYPSQGASVCFQSSQFGGTAQCCPGSPLCAELGN
jgi:hypothetical protein